MLPADVIINLRPVGMRHMKTIGTNAAGGSAAGGAMHCG